MHLVWAILSMLEYKDEKIGEILYVFLASQECPQRNLHCEGVPDDDEHHDKHIEME